MDYETEEMEWESPATEEAEEMHEDGQDLTPEMILYHHSQGVNTAELVEDSVLDKIANQCCDDFDRDCESRQGWDEDMKEWIKLAMQVKEEKSFPWVGAANIKFPLATVSVIQFASRISPAIIRTPYPVSGRVNGYQTDDKLAAADRLAKHMSYQLTDQMPTWVDDQDALFHILPIAGCAFKKTYRDATNNRNASELVMPDKLVFDYYAKSVEDARCVTHWYYMHEQELISRQRMGIFKDCEINPDPMMDGTDTRDEVNNTASDADTESKNIKILEQHTWYDLDEDGYEEPYICTVAAESKKVLRIEPRYTLSGIIRNQYNNEVARITADSYFTQYVFLPDPSGGNLGIGWGRILTPINESVNTLINQLLDKGTLNNVGGGFIDANFKVKAGNMEFQPGEMKPLAVNGQNIANGIFMIPQTEPSQVLYMLLTLLVNWGQRITAVTDSMAGEMPAANVPATTTLAMLEQGQKVFQGIYMRIYRALGRELKKLKELNRRYMDDQEYYVVLDGQSQSGLVFKNDYLRDDTDVTLTAEAQLPSEQVAMARLRICMEAANAGIRVNPQYVEKLLIQTLGLPEESAGSVLLPDQGPSPMEQAKMMEVQGRMQNEAQKNQIEAARVQTEQQRIQADTALKAADLRFKNKKANIDNMLKAQQVGTQQFQALTNANKAVG